MVSVELSVDLSKSFLISRKGTFVIFSSERMSDHNYDMRENKIDCPERENFEMFALPLFVFISQ